MRILGIDLGSSSIKAVEMDSAFGRYDIHDYHEHLLAPGENREEQVTALIKGLPKPPDRVIVAMSTSHSTFRTLQLPTKDRKAIQSGVGFELEDELPFSMEDASFDYTVLSQSKQGSIVHVAATLKKHVVMDLSHWEQSTVDPDIVTTEAWAYRTLLNRIAGPSRQESPILLIQIGHEKTTFYLHWRGAPSFIREVPWGGKDLTDAIAQKNSLSVEQAEKMKVDRGFIGEPKSNDSPTPEQIELSQCLQSALEKLVLDIRQVEMISKSTTNHSTGLIYVSGGTSLLPGLAQWLQDRLKIPTKPLRALSSITLSGVTYSDQTDARFLLAAALPLCLIGTDRNHCINFRKGEFSKQSRSREINFQVLKKPLMAFGIVLFCFFLSLFVQSRVYESRLATTNTNLEKSVRSYFGQVSSSALRTYLANTSALRTSINKELTKQREINRLFGPNPHSPLDFLNSLSSGVPRDVVVDMSQFQVGSSPTESFLSATPAYTASLGFLVSNPQMAEKLSNLLSDRMTPLERGKMEEVTAPDGSSKWKIVFSGKPTEESYGK